MFVVYGWDMDVRMLGITPGFLILRGRRGIGSVFKKNALGVCSIRTAHNRRQRGVVNEHLSKVT